MKPAVYADYNATTPVGNAARLAMENTFEAWGNPSSSHSVGRKAREILDRSRAKIAESIGVSPTEVVCTSGGSEANGLALLGFALSRKGLRCLTSGVEHSSIRDMIPLLVAVGATVQLVDVDREGQLVWPDFLEKLRSFKPHLVSLMTANNETGILFPIGNIAEVCHKNDTYLHTDAVQALGKIPSSDFLSADLISISSHKIYGPKGVGALVVRGGIQLTATHFGGSQELKRRGGTENLPGIAGFAGACDELIADGAPSLKRLRDRFETSLISLLSDIEIIGKNTPRLPNTSNIRFSQVLSSVLVPALDLDGICVSAGSACSSGSVSPSPALLAMGLTAAEASECLRFSFGRHTTESEIDEISTRVIQHVKRVRERRSKN